MGGGGQAVSLVFVILELVSEMGYLMVPSHTKVLENECIPLGTSVPRV